ncbi:divalent cation tolerance protein [Limimonas halophila]|uniref:Divalent cation tolerance protein n=1 Tax=Limimonas halophila TaxID=1082479 RepID=A0A1G7NP68_9PROT|nr:divalent-cation tolerance protein CutA [Limimonas halophila]SDF75776.1 divalent cation tolerance protein [Limimonas halophila]
MSYSLVYVTAGDAEEAKRLGRGLVEAHLAACANVFPSMVPIFWWDGEVQEDAEAVLIAKTRDDLVDQVIAFVKDRHTYDCPAVLAIPVRAGNAQFLDWIDSETRTEG